MSKTLVLVLNSGSSSLKYGVFEQRGSKTEPLCSGLVDKIGLEGTVVKHTVGESTSKTPVKLDDHKMALQKVTEILTAADGPVRSLDEVKIVGHRVVHGGATFSAPAIVDAATEMEIEKCTPLAPLHNPANVLGIRVAKDLFPAAKQVAVFDTAFHATMPPESFRYALPKDLYDSHSIRRYGFHGTSYKYVSAEAARRFGMPLEELNMVICHLGNGASMACLKNGKVVDTTMGLTPLEGLAMGTRSGDLDPGVFTFMCNQLGMTPKDVDTLLNKKSGLLGITGMSDMREVIAAAAKGNPDAILARAIFVQRIRKYLGSFLVKLDGSLDILAFTAGVGEGDVGMRLMVCDGLLKLGLEVDPEKNKTVDGDGEIQSASSRTKIMVIPTQEELSIAEQSLEVCGLAVPAAQQSTPGESTIPDKDAVLLPKVLQYNMATIAKANKQHIVLPEGEDPRIVAAAGQLLARDLCILTILGPHEVVMEHAKKAGVSVEGAAVINPYTAPIDDMVKALCGARNMTPEQATKQIRGDTTWFGTMLMYMGKADGMVSGAIHSTADTMRPALQVIKAAPGVSAVSSVFFMLLPDGVKLFSDCGLIPNPTTDQMAEIAMQTAKTARAFGIAPRIAMLSYATGDADKGEMIDKVREATKKAKALGPEELIEGPVQYDAAVDPRVAATKFKGKASPVAGKASVCIFPDLDAGNIAYKVSQQSAKCIAIGPIMQGMRMPVNDLSRGCTVQDAVECVIVTCLQSLAAKKNAVPSSKL